MSWETRLGEAASRMVDRYGVDITLTRVKQGRYDPMTDMTQNVTTNVRTKAVRGQIDHRFAPSFVKSEDGVMWISASELDFSPENGDQIIIGDIVYQVIGVETSHARNSDLLYTVFIRKA